LFPSDEDKGAMWHSALKNGKEEVREVKYGRHASSDIDQPSLPFTDHDSQKEYCEGNFKEEHGEDVKIFCDKEHLDTISLSSISLRALATCGGGSG
jgi:hypothetical protein